MSELMLRRFRAHPHFDTFLERCIAFLRTQNEPVLRVEDLLYEFATGMAQNPTLRCEFDLVVQMLLADEERLLKVLQNCAAVLVLASVHASPQACAAAVALVLETTEGAAQ